MGREPRPRAVGALASEGSPGLCRRAGVADRGAQRETGHLEQELPAEIKLVFPGRVTQSMNVYFLGTKSARQSNPGK